MDVELSKQGRRPLNLLFGFFALVGFFASLTTILDFFGREGASSIEVRVTQHKFLTPLYAGEAVQSGERARVEAQSLRTVFCEEYPDEEVLLTAYDDLAEKYPKDHEGVELCKKFQDIEFSSRWTGEYSESPATLYEYHITNTGSSVADGIRVNAHGLNSLQYALSEGRFVEVRPIEAQGFFALPKLNPRESMTVFAWTNGGYLNLDYREWDNLPIITFEGATVHTEFMKPVPDGWFNLYDIFVKDTPWIFLLLVILALSFAITAAFVILVSLIQAVYTGKPISSAFKADPEKEPSLKDDTILK